MKPFAFKYVVFGWLGAIGAIVLNIFSLSTWSYAYIALLIASVVTICYFNMHKSAESDLQEE